MNTQTKNYESPQLDVMEIEIEQTILQSSMPDFGDGGNLW